MERTSITHGNKSHEIQCFVGWSFHIQYSPTAEQVADPWTNHFHYKTSEKGFLSPWRKRQSVKREVQSRVRMNQVEKMISENSQLAQGKISLCGCFTKHVWKKPNHTCLVISTRMCNKTHLCGQSHTAGPCVVCGFYHTRVGKTKHVWKSHIYWR